jgi:mono/diheme cytochrome c family protein
MESALRRALSAFGRGRDRADLVDERFRLSGADLYRLECRSCHGPAGRGAPPEIPSLLATIRAISPQATPEGQEPRGTPAGAGRQRGQASQAVADLRALLQGGGKMPSFERLRDDEVGALLGFLQELAGVDAGQQADRRVTESVARVGEHLVKGTCHVCHDATGPGGRGAGMMGGGIPSLASVPAEYSLDSVLYKVERGSSGMMGMMGMMGAGEKMPAFPYLSQEEVTAAYLYLEAYRPSS